MNNYKVGQIIEDERGWREVVKVGKNYITTCDQEGEEFTEFLGSNFIVKKKKKYMGNLKFRKVGINQNINPDISITPLDNNKFRIFSEKSGLLVGVYSKKYLLDRKTLTINQINNIKGTTNFVVVKR